MHIDRRVRRLWNGGQIDAGVKSGQAHYACSGGKGHKKDVTAPSAADAPAPPLLPFNCQSGSNLKIHFSGASQSLAQ
ncbi:MAG: hypothetical protein COS85_13750 [Armatimonadetes bacterium CG07_land_8_20_14_0_80_59_28]|nr:MAG: hypothetical protein COS85_13750 [Armatimonadetes bacterium CG07_land_8_20_14_0_80_59_28]